MSTTNATLRERLYTRAKELVLSGVRKAKSRGISCLSYPLIDPQHFRLVYLRTFWCEFCNLYRRMEILRRARLHRCGIGLRTPSESAQKRHVRYREWLLIRNICIRRILSIHPRATLIDLHLATIIARSLFVEGYRKVEVPLHHIPDPQEDRQRIREMVLHTRNGRSPA